jgi:hypothetical protein
LGIHKCLPLKSPPQLQQAVQPPRTPQLTALFVVMAGHHPPGASRAACYGAGVVGGHWLVGRAPGTSGLASALSPAKVAAETCCGGSSKIYGLVFGKGHL